MSAQMIIRPWPWSRRASGGLTVKKCKWGWYARIEISGHRTLQLPCDVGFVSRDEAIADAKIVAGAIGIPFVIEDVKR